MLEPNHRQPRYQRGQSGLLGDEIVDLLAISGSVGRVPKEREWYIVDRTIALAKPVFFGDGDADAIV